MRNCTLCANYPAYSDLKTSLGVCSDDVLASAFWKALTDAIQPEPDGLAMPATTRVARVAVPKQSYACRHWHGVWLRDWG